MNRHFLLTALLIVLSLFSYAQGYQVQSKYFVYLQTEPAQPFYIKINDQQINANASGYLILPQLKDGDYKLIVGFTQGNVPEQAFNFKIDSKDKGYLIKDYGADGWGLFDLQTMAVQKPMSAEELANEKQQADKKENERKAAILARRKQQEEERLKAQREEEARLLEEQQKQQQVTVAPSVDTIAEKQAASANNIDPNVSDFTKVLSQAAKDPTLLEKPQEPKVEEKPIVVNKEQESPQNTNKESIEEKSSVPKRNNGAENALISQTKSADGVTLVYDNRNELGQVDPITIFIAAPNAIAVKEPEKPQVNETINTNQVPTDDVKTNVTTGNADDDTKFEVEEKPTIAQNTDDKKEAVKITNDACKSIASDDDFLKLRRTMASESNDDNMIAQAEKAFKSKCYTTAQIKYLSSMFLSNAGKYNFYKVAQPHIADRENFASLAAEIKDQTYKDKFNQLL